MDKKQLETILKQTSNNKSVRLPAFIDMALEAGRLTMTVNDPVGNMQTDSAAFEAWALALKANIDGIKNVVLDVNGIPPEGSKSSLHSNRLLWRASNFESLFDWFQIGNFKPETTALQNRFVKADRILINQPGGTRTRPQKSTGEVYVEWLFANTNAYKRELQNATGCDFLVNQFPVGIFENTVSDADKIFNGNKSAIDLVGLEGRDIVHLFELKTGANRRMGILSEFLFYAFVLHNLFQLQTFFFESPLKQMDFLKFNGLVASQIKGHLLAEKFHPLLSKKVMDLLNQGLEPMRISLDAVSYERPTPDTLSNIQKAVL